MSDDLRSLFEHSLDAVPVPAHSASGAAHRGRRMVRRRLVLGALAAAVLVGLSAAVANDVVGDRSSIPPVERPDEEIRRAIDIRARLVIDALGPLCRGYDFYYVSDVGDGLHRPVQCGMDRSFRARAAETPPVPSSPAPAPSTSPTAEEFRTRLLRGPRIVVYAFSSSAVKNVWLDTHLPFWGGRIAGDAWVVDVVDRAMFGPVRRQLHGGDVLARPTRTWALADHVIRPVPEGYEPRVPLPRASRYAIARRPELLSAQLGRFGDHRSEGPPAWILTFRRCVPQYGGPHARPNCSFDHLHVAIDTESGRRIERFWTSPRV